MADDDKPNTDDKPAGDDKPDDFTPIASQDEFNRRLSDRLTRERAKFADYDDLKAKAAEHDKAIEAAKDEHQKAVDAARKEGETTATTAANVKLIASEARALAAEAKFRNPSLAVKTLDLKDIKVSDDGEVDAAAVKAKLEELAKAEPYLVDDGKVRVKPDKSQGGDGGGDTRPSVAAGRDLYDARRPKKAAASA